MLSARYENISSFWLDKMRRELPAHLLYHGVGHTINVVNACSYLAGKEKVNPEQKELLLVAALFHDSGFLVRYVDNEHAAARIAADTLPAYNYLPNEIEEIQHIIISTSMSQEPKGLLQEIIHDADLNYLGRPDYERRADDLRREMAFMGQSFEDLEWLNMQLHFLEQFEYCTASAKRLVSSGLEKNRVLIRRKIEELGEG